MTLISRLLGFVRDMVIANVFGVSASTDAFFIAFKLPNFLRRLFVEGAFAQAFVPLLSQAQQFGDKADLKRRIDSAASRLLVVYAVMSVVGIVAAPLLILLFAPGLLWAGDQFDLAVQLLQITFPYLLFIGLTAFFGSILQAHGHFAVPAITPALLNIGMILAAVVLAPQLAQPITALAWGVLLAGVAQWLFQLPALWRLELLPRWRWARVDTGSSRLMPALLGGAVMQINVLIGTLFASFLPAGSVSWLYYSDRLVEFPLGLFGVTIGTVMLPSLARQYAQQQASLFSATLDWGLRLTCLIALPATLGLCYLAKPLLSTLFQHQAFGATDVVMASKSLVGFALGLWAFCLVNVLSSAFSAQHDTATPARCGVMAIVCAIGLNAVLITPLAHAGPALATALAAYLQAGLLGLAALRRGLWQPDRALAVLVLRVLLASASMALFLDVVVAQENGLGWSAGQRVIHLLLTIAEAVLVFGLSLWAAGFRPRQLTAPA